MNQQQMNEARQQRQCTTVNTSLNPSQLIPLLTNFENNSQYTYIKIAYRTMSLFVKPASFLLKLCQIKAIVNVD